MRIFLVRHGESIGNLDYDIYKKQADHNIELSNHGMEQAQKAGKFLNHFIKNNPIKLETQNEVANQLLGNLLLMLNQQDKGNEINKSINKVNESINKVKIWKSPYKRARETSRIIEGSLGNLVVGSREDVLLVEQQWGLFDGLNDQEQEKSYPKEFECIQKNDLSKGKFWSKFPLGESGLDIATRIRIFFESLYRDKEEGINNHIIISHGTTIRIFIQMWMGYSHEWFHDESVPKNCSIRLIDNNKDKGYIYKGKDD